MRQNFSGGTNIKQLRTHIGEPLDEKNKILVYGMIGNNTGGGVDKYLLQMSSYMKNTTFDYVIEGFSCDWEEEITQRGGTIYYITQKNTNPLKNILDNLYLLSNLRKTHKTVYFNLGSLSWLAPIKIALFFGYGVFVHSHMSKRVRDDFAHKTLYTINKSRLKRLRCKRLACSDSAACYMFFPNDAVEIINNAIEIEKYSFDSNIRDRMRSKIGINKEKTIGFVGRLVEQKNPLFLPDILKSALLYDTDCKMIIVGEGDLGQSLRDKINKYGLNDKCILTGNVRNVEEYLQAMDVFVMPSLHEGLPFTMVEAQASGLQCVASDSITMESNITGNVQFLPIEDANLWGQALHDIFSKKNYDRNEWSDYMKESPFDIKKEAIRLEGLLNRRES